MTAAIADVQKLLGKLPQEFFSTDDLAALAFEAEVAFGGSDILDKHLAEMVHLLSEDMLRERFTNAMQELAQAERSGNTEQAAALLAECKRLGEELNRLYQYQQ